MATTFKEKQIPAFRRFLYIFFFVPAIIVVGDPIDVFGLEPLFIGLGAFLMVNNYIIEQGVVTTKIAFKEAYYKGIKYPVLTIILIALIRTIYGFYWKFSLFYMIALGIDIIIVFSYGLLGVPFTNKYGNFQITEQNKGFININRKSMSQIIFYLVVAELPSLVLLDFRSSTVKLQLNWVEILIIGLFVMTYILMAINVIFKEYIQLEEE